MQVRVREKCKTCDGTGILAHPKWVEANRQFKAAEWNTPAWTVKWENFWKVRGYDVDHLPPEEYDCGDCNGTGHVERWIELAELARQPELVMLML